MQRNGGKTIDAYLFFDVHNVPDVHNVQQLDLGLERREQKVGKKIKAIEKKLEEYDAIHHSEIPHGTAAVEHVFESENPFDNVEL